jgi:polar amino acid transport system permease protein
VQFDFTVIGDSWRYLGKGLLFTVSLWIATAVLSTFLGILLALARSYGPFWAKPAIAFYVDSMRAVPLLVIMVWIYFALPLVTGVNFPAFVAALIALTFQSMAYICEIVRAGISSVRGGQMGAGLALGMSKGAVVRKVILPQAVVRVLPPYGSMLAAIGKNTAIASVIAVPEFMQQSTVLAAQTFRPIEIFTSALIVYFLMIFPGTRVVDLIYRRIEGLGRS